MITLSIVSHRQADLIAALVNDLDRISSPLVDTVIVTRNVAESSPAWPKGLAARVETIKNDAPRGFGANHNAAFAHCATPYFAILNPDLRLSTDPFPALLDALNERSHDDDAPRGTGLVTPRIVAPDGTQEDLARALITPLDLMRRRVRGASSTPPEPDWLAGMFFLATSEAFRAMHGFDERYFMYCEDFDLCARLRLSGWSFRIVEEAVVIHDARRASHRSPLHFSRHVASLVRMWGSETFWNYRRMLSRRSSASR